MSSCCHCCKCPKTNYKLDTTTCGVCTLMGKTKCYFEHSSPTHNRIGKTFESANLSTKRPYQSPQFSESNRDRPVSESKRESYNDESVFVSPFEISKNHTVVIPVYYDVQVPIYPKNYYIPNQEELTTFRPYLPSKKDIYRSNRKEPMHPNQLFRTLNIQR